MELCHPLAVILSLPVSTHTPSTRVEEMWFASRSKGGLEWEASAAQMRGQHKTAVVFGSPEGVPSPYSWWGSDANCCFLRENHLTSLLWGSKNLSFAQRRVAD